MFMLVTGRNIYREIQYYMLAYPRRSNLILKVYSFQISRNLPSALTEVFPCAISIVV